MKALLFVYGTLRRTHPRTHRRLLRNARFLGPASISGTLYELGLYPGVYRTSKRKKRVGGELYDLADGNVHGKLAALDRYEGSEFKRTRVMVQLSDGRRHLAWAYLLAAAPPQTVREIRSGVYKKHRTGSSAP